MATLDLRGLQSGRVNVGDSSDTVLLEVHNVYALSNQGSQIIYFSTNGEAPTAAADTKLGHGYLEKSAVIRGNPLRITGVDTLIVVCDTGLSSLLTITQAGVVT